MDCHDSLKATDDNYGSKTADKFGSNARKIEIPGSLGNGVKSGPIGWYVSDVMYS